MDLREISRAAFCVALALVLPAVFHALQLGHVFLPMYLPLLLGAFLVRPATAGLAAFGAPLLSALLTGMPPLVPPVAVWMAVELGAMAFAASWLRRGLRWPPIAVLAIALVGGRLLYAALVYGTSLLLHLPAGLLTVASLLSPWPGILLALAALPPVVALVERRDRSHPSTDAEPP
jgi:hypothetical protein